MKSINETLSAAVTPELKKRANKQRARTAVRTQHWTQLWATLDIPHSLRTHNYGEAHTQGNRYGKYPAEITDLLTAVTSGVSRSVAQLRNAPEGNVGLKYTEQKRLAQPRHISSVLVGSRCGIRRRDDFLTADMTDKHDQVHTRGFVTSIRLHCGYPHAHASPQTVHAPLNMRPVTEYWTYITT